MKAFNYTMLLPLALALLAAGTHAEGSSRLAPAQTFRFKAHAYGCVSKDKFDAAFQHAQAGEKARMQEFFAGYDCLATPETADFKVLQVVGHDVEFVNTASNDREGMWTTDAFIK